MFHSYHLKRLTLIFAAVVIIAISGSVACFFDDDPYYVNITIINYNLDTNTVISQETDRYKSTATYLFTDVMSDIAYEYQGLYRLNSLSSDVIAYAGSGHLADDKTAEDYAGKTIYALFNETYYGETITLNISITVDGEDSSGYSDFAGVSISPVNLVVGDVISGLNAPEVNGYTFDGWYSGWYSYSAGEKIYKKRR